MNPHHQTFINTYLEGQDKEKAYAAAYPTSKSSTYRSTANRLLSRPEIKAAIDKRSTLINATVDKKVTAGRLQQAIDKEEARVLLQNIIRGQHITYKNVRVKDGFKQVEVYASHAQILRALTLYMKMEGIYPETKPQKQQQQQQQTTEEANDGYWITVGDEPLCPVAGTEYEQWYPADYAGTHWDPTQPAERSPYLKYINSLGAEERRHYLDQLERYDRNIKACDATTSKQQQPATTFYPLLERRGAGEVPEPVKATCVKRQQPATTLQIQKSELKPASIIQQQLTTTSNNEYISLQEALDISNANRRKNITSAAHVQANRLSIVMNNLKQNKVPTARQRAMLAESGWELHPTNITKVRTCPCRLNLGTATRMLVNNGNNKKATH